MCNADPNENIKNRPAVKSDWETLPMPFRCAHFTLKRTFSEEEMAALRHGNIPQEMEDKWFFYMENEKLYAHRSWTGCCIYIVRFRKNNVHQVTVNREPSQYTCTSINEDREQLNDLLNWWSKPSYDYYGEFLDETVKTLGKMKGNS